MKKYVEDSTKGKALKRPRNYKGDTLVQAWVDRRKLAVLSKWLDEGGYRTMYLSDLVKYTIDEVVSNLIENGIVEKVEFTNNATQILVGKYRAELNPGGRGLRNLDHNLTLDEMRRNRAYEYEIGQTVVSSTLEQESREFAEKAEKVYRKLEAEEQIKPNDVEEEVGGSKIEVHNRLMKKLGGEQLDDFGEDLKRIEEEDKALSSMDMSAPKGGE